MGWFKSDTKEQKIDDKVNSILGSIIDSVHGFTHREQSLIIKKVNEKFVYHKKEMIKESEQITDEIKESLKIL